MRAKPSAWLRLLRWLGITAEHEGWRCQASAGLLRSAGRAGEAEPDRRPSLGEERDCALARLDPERHWSARAQGPRLVTAPMAASLASRRTVARGACAAASAFGSSARAGAAAAVSSRGYFRVPEIKVTLDSVNAAMASGALKKRPGDKGTRNWLNEQEQRVNSRAKRTGVLELGSSCTQDVVTMYQKVCWDRAHLFVSLTKHGDQVVVDANPSECFAACPRGLQLAPRPARARAPPPCAAQSERPVPPIPGHPTLWGGRTPRLARACAAACPLPCR